MLMPKDTVTDDILDVFDRAIKLVWSQSIRSDYLGRGLFREDSLKAAMYHHLRTRLGDEWLNANRIRLFTEYPLDGAKRADIAIVRLQPLDEGTSRPQSDYRVDEVLCLIECKYKNASVNLDPFLSDVEKINRHAHRRAYAACHFYLASIHEKAFPEDEAWLLDKRQQHGWGRRVVELTGSYVQGRPNEPVFRIISYNGRNPDLSSEYSPT